MGVYWFMFAWVMIFGIVAQISAKKVCIGEDRYEYRANLFMALVTFSVIIFFAGMRTTVADTGAYVKIFEEYPLFTNIQSIILDENVREPGFKLFSILIKTFIANNYNVWFFIIATISGICVMIPLYKYSCNFVISVFIFMASCQFIWMFNGIRQFLVASIMFACSGLILKHRSILYIIIVCILSTFHISAFVLIPVYFIVEDEPWSRKNMLFIIGIVIIILFAGKFTNLLMDVVENTDYAVSINEVKDLDDGTNIIRVLIECVPTIMAFIYRKKIKDQLTPIIKISINMSVIASGLYIVSFFIKSGILLGRFPIYFSMYNLILLPWLIKNIFEKKERDLITYLMIVLYFVFFYYQMCVAWGGLGYGSEMLNIKYKW